MLKQQPSQLVVVSKRKSVSTAKKNGRRRDRERRKMLMMTMTGDETGDNDAENLNRALRAVCNAHQQLKMAHQQLELAHEISFGQNALLQEALTASVRRHDEDKAQHLRQLQDVHFNAIMDRTDIIRKMTAEQSSLTRRLTFQRTAAENEQESLNERIETLEMKNVALEKEKKELEKTLDEQREITSGALETANNERVSYMDALGMAKEAYADLEAARMDISNTKEDLNELLRLDAEEKERASLGLPPAYGGLDNLDNQVRAWDAHCQDVGRLDGGGAGDAMKLLESVAEEMFAVDLRRAVAVAAKLRLSRDPANQDAAGPRMFHAASVGITGACQSLTSGMEHVLHQYPPAKKRRLSTTSPTQEPASKRPSNSKHRAVPTPREQTPTASRSLPALTPLHSNYTLAHRATNQIFSFFWQLIAAFDLRPLPVPMVDDPLRFRVAQSWRMIDDSLRGVMELSAKSPLNDVDDTGRCTGCTMKGCAGNCARLSKLQGYVTQLDAVRRGLKNICADGAKAGWFLGDCHEAMEDMVAIERRCAAEGRGDASVRHVEFVDLTNDDETMEAALGEVVLPAGTPSSSSHVPSRRMTQEEESVGPRRSVLRHPDQTHGEWASARATSDVNVDLTHDRAPRTTNSSTGPTPTPGRRNATTIDSRRDPRLPNRLMEPQLQQTVTRRNNDLRRLESPASPPRSPPVVVLSRPLQVSTSPGALRIDPVENVVYYSPTSPVESVSSSEGSVWEPPGGFRVPISAPRRETFDVGRDYRYTRPTSEMEGGVFGEGSEHARRGVEEFRVLGAAARRLAAIGAGAATAAAEEGRQRREGLRPRRGGAGGQ